MLVGWSAGSSNRALTPAVFESEDVEDFGSCHWSFSRGSGLEGPWRVGLSNLFDFVFVDLPYLMEKAQ